MALPVRTAATAAVVGVSGLVAVAVFTSSLARLDSNPSRYGVAWDASMELLSSPSGRDALDQLVVDRDVTDVGVATIGASRLEFDGVPAAASLLSTVKGEPLMVVSEGRAPRNDLEVALGPSLLDEIGKSVGDSVDVTDTDGSVTSMTIVGSTYSLEYQSSDFNRVANYVTDDIAALGPDEFSVVLVRFADGVDVEAAIAAIDDRHPYAVMNESFPYPPPEVINLAQLGSLPRALALFLAFLAVTSLLHALLVTGRSRRRDLGVLRALGLTSTQVAVVLVSTTATIVGAGLDDRSPRRDGRRGRWLAARRRRDLRRHRQPLPAARDRAGGGRRRRRRAARGDGARAGGSEDHARRRAAVGVTSARSGRRTSRRSNRPAGGCAAEAAGAPHQAVYRPRTRSRRRHDAQDGDDTRARRSGAHTAGAQFHLAARAGRPSAPPSPSRSAPEDC